VRHDGQAWHVNQLCGYEFDKGRGTYALLEGTLCEAGGFEGAVRS
jgi:hypothetical protein